MRGKGLVLLLLLAGCTNDFFPEGLYDYQVERLLSNDNEKVWLQVINSTNCSDSTRLHVMLLSGTVEDSIQISTLRPSVDCSGFDTLLIGNANASVFENGLLFTDSLNFSNESYWIVNFITAEALEIWNGQATINYRSSVDY